MGFAGLEERAQFQPELSVFAPWDKSLRYNEEQPLQNKPIFTALATGPTTYASTAESDRQSVYSDDTASVADSIFDIASVASSQSSYGSSASDSSEDSSDGETGPTPRVRQPSARDAQQKLDGHSELLSGLGSESLPLRFNLHKDGPQEPISSYAENVPQPQSRAQHPAYQTIDQNNPSRPQTAFKQPLHNLQKTNRRRSINSEAPAAPPCRLKRDTDSADCFVMTLITFAARLITAIWPLSACPPMMSSCFNGAGVLPLEVFIHETLRRSKTSYSTLQVALWYLMLLKCQMPKNDLTKEPGQSSCRAMQCGRRMFLAALMLASKYLQDRNYSTRAWSKISGLRICEINENEMKYLEAIDYRLHITKDVFDNWSRIVLTLSKLSKLKPGCPLGRAQISPLGSGDWSALSAMVDDSPALRDENAFFSDKWWNGVLASLDPHLCDTEEGSKQFLRQSLPAVDLSHPLLRLDQGMSPAFDSPVDKAQTAFSSPALQSLHSGASTPVQGAEGHMQSLSSLPLRPQLRNLPTPVSTPRGPEGCYPTPSQMNLRCSASVDALRSVRKQCFANANLDRCPPPRPQSYCAAQGSRMRPAASIPFQSQQTPSPSLSEASDTITPTGRSRSSSISSNSSWSSSLSSQPMSAPFNLEKIINQPPQPSPLTRVVSMPETRVPVSRSINGHPLRRKPQFSDIAAARTSAAAVKSRTDFGTGQDLVQETDAAEALLRLCAGRREMQQQILSATQQATQQHEISPRGHKRNLSNATEPIQDHVRQLLQQERDGDEIMSDSALKIHDPSDELEKKWQAPTKTWALHKKPVTTIDHKRMALYCAPHAQLSAPELTALKLKEQLVSV
ncbi:uncharacterized protein HMPREF1541_04637 [Cyphellophora europaea CBS 101466]|uniref:Cyclin N-terminal domain-containing protein n=1 Tax=Cyphellophora europaea (strain CBS 101466) TaxID=1220924 RepID=W2RVN0_CYPE1|nr:uncharacterized protein HMPREF1541_04637 [Cyphellophora europaea CBS 101466]ETN40360.1 hypothetical protein HMPREF1541_04637 [Cyphellophora europaea CBS 101466]